MPERWVRIRPWLAALAVPALLLGGAADAQERSVAVQRRGPLRVEVDPGKTVSTIFVVSNLGAGPVQVRGEADLPAGWRRIVPEVPAHVAPGGTVSRLLSVSVPSKATAGSHTLRYVVQGLEPSERAVDSVIVNVRERRALELTLTEAPRFAVAGVGYTTRFLVTNLGNAAGRVALRIRSDHGLAARTDSTTIVLHPGQARPVPVSVVAEGEEGRSFIHNVELSAVWLADTTAAASASSRVEIIPGSGGGGPRFHRLPVEVKVRAAELGGAGIPLEISGSGPLFRGGSTRVDFRARGPDGGRSFLGEREEYRLEIRGSDFDLHLGDRVYALSPLTEPGRYGFGAGGTLSAGPLTAGGFTQRNRWSMAPEEQHAAFVGYGRDSPVQVSGNYVTTTGTTEGTAWTVRSTLRLLRAATLDVEYGAGNRGDAGGRGRMAHLYGFLPWLTYDLRHQQADRNFPALFRGTRSDDASVRLTPWRRLFLSATLNRYTRDSLPGDLDFGIGRSHQLLRAGAGYGELVTMEARRHESAGELLGIPFDRLGESVLARVGLRHGRVWLRPSAEAGTVVDRGIAEATPFHAFSAQGGLSTGGGHSLSFSADRFAGRSVETGLVRDELAGSAHASVNLPRTRLSLSLTGRRDLGGASPDNAAADVGIQQQLPFGHRLQLRARTTYFAGAPPVRPLLAVDYVVPLGVPVTRLGGSGGMAGRILDTATGSGIGGIPVRIGDRVAITDARGGWRISGLQPGTHYLQPDRLSIGLERVFTLEVPLPVQVRGGRIERIELGVVRSGRVRGNIRLYTAPTGAAGGAPVGDGGVRDAVVELSRGEDVQRRVADAAGAFDFSDLRPGRWKLVVLAAELPAHHRLERDSLEIELGEGGAEEVLLRAVARVRPMQIIAGGSIALQPGRSPRPAPAPSARPAAIPVAAPIDLAKAPTSAPSAAAVAPPPRAVDLTSREALPALAPRAVIGRPVRPSATPATPVVHAGQGVVGGQAPLPAVPTAATAVASEPSPSRRPRTGITPDLPIPPYTVEPGDRSLVDIAWLVYNDPALWPKIWMANRTILTTPDLIRPGQVLTIPAKAPLTAAERAAQRRYRVSNP